MAKETPTPAAGGAGEKMIECKVRRRYGNNLPGVKIKVTEREYNRLREPVLDNDGEPTGRFTYPVLINAEHEAAEAAAKAKSDADALKRRQDDERGAGPGWADFERRSLEVVRANFATAQQRQAELVTGAAATASASG